MKIDGTRVLVLGGAGLVGTAVCRELFAKRPAEVIIHSRRAEKAEAAREELLAEAASAKLTALSPEQAEYLGIGVDGPYKGETYRY